MASRVATSTACQRSSAASPEAERDVAHDLPLARGEGLERRLDGLGAVKGRHHPDMTVGHRPDRIHQRLDGEALEDDAARARADGRQRVFGVLAGRHDDHARLRCELADVGERAAVHLEVEEQDVTVDVGEHRMEGVHLVRLGDDGHLGPEGEQRPQPLAEEGMIVGDRHPDRHPGCGSNRHTSRPATRAASAGPRRVKKVAA